MGPSSHQPGPRRLGDGRGCEDRHFGGVVRSSGLPLLERLAGAHQVRIATWCRNDLSRPKSYPVSGREEADELFDGRPSVGVWGRSERRLRR
jgi:hypothetical protein